MKNRIERIEEEIKRKLSSIIKKLKDPRIPKLVSITKVQMTNDLSLAKIFVSIIDKTDTKNEAYQALVNAHGFIRKEIGECVHLRRVPEIKFMLDDSTEYALHIEKIIQEV
jgi:ribosome-binding factor A